MKNDIIGQINNTSITNKKSFKINRQMLIPSIMFFVGIVAISYTLFVPVFAQTNDLDTDKNIADTSNRTDWKTYESQLIGISFDYPAGWDVDEKQNRFDSGSDVSVSTDDLKFFVMKLERTEDIPLSSSAVLPTARQFAEALTKDETNTIVEPASIYKYNIGGEKTGTFLTKTDNGISQYGTQTFDVIKNGDVYVLNFRDSTKTFDTPETQMIMNKILQSFKFLN